MQKTAAYLLERVEGVGGLEGRRRIATDVRDCVEAWLRSKGGSGVGANGEYRAEDGSTGTWSRHRADDGDRSWTLLRLDERSAEGRHVAAYISTTETDERVLVYATIEVGSDESGVRIVEADSRCPRVVREVLNRFGPWNHGDTRLQGRVQVLGFGGGAGFADDLTDPERTVPIVVVSEDGDDVVLPRLDEKLAYDLAGLANVVRVDADAAWGITDVVGRSLSCFDGGVRLYWPGLTVLSDPYRHPVWTANRLLASGADPRAVRERLRKQLRVLVMRASALSAVRPREIDEIRIAEVQRGHADLLSKATTVDEYRELAQSYAHDADDLRVKLAKAESDASSLNVRIASLESERDALRRRCEAVERRAREVDDDIEGGGEPGGAPEPGPPSEREVRFYKKRAEAPTHDIFIRVPDCEHDNWQGANKADKAKKGVKRLEGRDDWRTFRHCAVCTGGGMWRVEW